MNIDNIIKPDKYSIEIKQSSKKEWYIGSIKVNSNNQEELELALEEACNIAIKKLEHINNSNKLISSPKEEIELSSEAKELFVLLKGLRKKIAERENMPSFIVFCDSTLKEIASKKPHSKEEMLGINGVGEINFEKYGKEFLSFLIQH